MKNVTYQLRLPEELRDQFLEQCKINGLTGASVLKHFIVNYLSRNEVVVPNKTIEKPFKPKTFSYFDEDLNEHWVDSDELQLIAHEKGWKWLSDNLIRSQISPKNNAISLSDIPSKPKLSRNQQKRMNKKKKK